MKKVEDPDATPETHRELEKVTEFCEICQRLSKAPGRLLVSFSNETIGFNRIVLTDLMTMEGQKVLHIVERDIFFSAACFRRDRESEKDVWGAYIRYLVITYAGYSHEIHEYQGPQCKSSEWK